MLISRLLSQIARVSRCTEIWLSLPAERFLTRSATSLPTPRLVASARYSTQPSSKNGIHPQQWHALDPELEEVLVPRKLSVSPLESWLTVQYSLLERAVKAPPEPAQEYELPPCSWGTEEEEEEWGGEPNRDRMECKNILKIRRRKMNKHKYKKLMKRTKFLRKKIKDGRRKKKQKRFERDLERIWRRAGLKKAPEGWETPKIYLTKVKLK
ncbi:aurora kinase A-interacting protein isoform X1 [Varanus komodoensis]|uniref:aurora kinase A-interacting protein isoform X1 n=1 Tax=Varanus komodoensis TaxID=61221 RepID=UPI001CF7D4C1|nr:aurora kinase A-interacting protein isoform X1 [Varanus komodoensis]XP_044301193.1 aurora kinase A-interacting protein isoform X1 [Varanus komodoensis]